MQQVPLSNQYETESKLPAIHSISYSINRLPVVLRFLPAIGTFIALAQITSREKLLGKDQIPYLQRLSGCIGASTIIASSICLCSYIPLLAIELMHNGDWISFLPCCSSSGRNHLHFKCSPVCRLVYYIYHGN